MTIFCRENLSNSSKRCRILRSTLKDVFANCHACNRRRLTPYTIQDSEEETPTSDFDEVQEVVISMIRSRAMKAKLRRGMMTDGFSSVFHPTSGELFIRAKQENEEDEVDDFATAQSHFSYCLSAAADSEAFYSVKSDFSTWLTLNNIDFPEWASEALDNSELRRRAIIQEFCHCEGWPFGLCRKALLLPPLPKSPSDSWTWCKGTTKIIKTN